MRWRRNKSAPPASSQAPEVEEQESLPSREQGFHNDAGPTNAAVFEFGTRPGDGLGMQGVCKAQEPGELQTCFWMLYDPSRAPAGTIEKEAELRREAGVTGNPAKYHIEF